MKYLDKWKIWTTKLKNIKQMSGASWLMDPPNTIKKNYLVIG
jgi:hypothetical protein